MKERVGGRKLRGGSEIREEIKEETRVKECMAVGQNGEEQRGRKEGRKERI